MKCVDALGYPVAQQEFAVMIGVSEARVSQLVAGGVLSKGDTALEWLGSYCERLRDQAAGRAGSELGGLDLVQERAALAREQRMGIEIKNATLRKEFSPVGLLSEVLATACQSVVERFEQIPSSLKKSCPDLPDAAREQVMVAMAAARNEWVRATEKLVSEKLAQIEEDEIEEGDL